MQKKSINIRCQNGLSLEGFIAQVFDVNKVSAEFEFIEADNPDFIIFGPYGNNIPPKGNYVRIAYYCENMMPDLTNCEWAFGMADERVVNHPRYRQIRWHDIDPSWLIKKTGDAEALLSTKTLFCNFLYSHRVPYREEFFRQLSKYKKVDAPGRSMNNMPFIDNGTAMRKWEAKRQFLSRYKFTIAFENYSYPGYQTEKLFDAMLSASVPVYCGDPYVGDTFNTRSFLNTPEYLDRPNGKFTHWLERVSQPTFIDILPQFHHTPADRLRRKLKKIGRNLKMNIAYKKADYTPLIDKIIELDRNPEQYLEMMREPWFKGNQVPEFTYTGERWAEIFRSFST